MRGGNLYQFKAGSCVGEKNIHMSISASKVTQVGGKRDHPTFEVQVIQWRLMKDSVRLSSSYGVNYHRLWRPCKASVSICIGKGAKCSSISIRFAPSQE